MFAEEFIALLNESHKACKQGLSEMQPSFWMYPFVRADAYGPSKAGLVALQTSIKLNQAASHLLLETEVGLEFNNAIICQFLFRKALRLSFRDPKLSTRKYVWFNNEVWSSQMELSDEQWRSAIEQLKINQKAN